MKRSVERVKGVKSVSVDLTTGRANVVFEAGANPRPEKLWDAVVRSGFTPDRIETKDDGVYQRPSP